jgi:magnesium-transporting ATPase (P-type)
MDDETLRKEEQIYQQAMATYRHFHAFIASCLLVIAMIVGAGIVLRWIVVFQELRGWAWVLAIILVAVVVFLLILFAFVLAVLIYTERSRMCALDVACRIERSWFPSEEDREKCLAHKLKDKEERNLVCKLLKSYKK